MTLPSCTVQAIRKAFPEQTGDWFQIPNPVTTDGHSYLSLFCVIRIAPAIRQIAPGECFSQLMKENQRHSPDWQNNFFFEVSQTFVTIEQIVFMKS